MAGRGIGPGRYQRTPVSSTEVILGELFSRSVLALVYSLCRHVSRLPLLIQHGVTYRLGRLLRIGFDPLATSEGGPERSKIGTTVDVVISLKQRLDRIGRFLCVVVWYAAKDGIS